MSVLTEEQFVNLKLLQSVEGIGNQRLRNLLSKYNDINSVFEADLYDLSNIDSITLKSAKKILAAKDTRAKIEEEVKKELENLYTYNSKIITIWDEEYPYLLKKIYDPPIYFYLRGKLDPIDNYSLAVVGTRVPTNYGKVQAERIATEISREGITIVSGLARGIDSIAHTAAVNCKGRTIAVVGSGLDVYYPSENKNLYHKILENGCIISEYPFGTLPNGIHFPERNRIIAGLSVGIVVIETTLTGGALQTAALGLDYNREIFAVPGNLGVRQSEGTNKLIQKGEAKLVANVDDILAEIEIKIRPQIKPRESSELVNLNLFEQKIYDVLDSEPLHIDVIADKSGLSISDCLVNLLTLEFNGFVKQLPGKLFAKL